MNNDKIKIAIITRSLANGGAERCAALLSFLLSNLGFQIHIVSIFDEIEFEYKGKLMNLGILKNKNDNAWGRLNRLLVFK